MVVRMAEIYGCDLYAFLCSRRAGGMTGYRYAPVRVRSFRPDCSCVYGILVRKLEGERTVALTVIPGCRRTKRRSTALRSGAAGNSWTPPVCRRSSGRIPGHRQDSVSEHPGEFPAGCFCLRFYSRDAKSAMASEIFSCWGQTASQLRQPMQALGHLSCGRQRGPWGPGSRRR